MSNSPIKSPLWERWENLKSSLNYTGNDSEESIMELLKQVPIFQNIPTRGLQSIRTRCHLRQFKEGEHVFRNGEPGVGMYIILKGSIRIYHELTDVEETLAELVGGDFFGEIGLLEDMDEFPRTASAQAMSHCMVLGFYRPDLTNIMERDPRLSTMILQNISRFLGIRLINNNLRMEKLTHENEQYRLKINELVQALNQKKSEEGSIQ